MGNAQPLDISGYRIIQTNFSYTIVLPQGTTIVPGGYLIIGRNISKTGFENFWGITLGQNVGFINGFSVIGENGFPVINGDETYTLQNSSSGLIEGPTPALVAGQSVQRASVAGAATSEASWSRGSQTTATPGSGMTNTGSGKLIISEFSDASSFVNEFVELYYDATPPETGPGTAFASPPVRSFDVPADLTIGILPMPDTIRGLRVVIPPLVQWSLTGAVLPSGATAQRSGDTLTVTGFVSIAQESTIVRLTGVTASDSTAELTLGVQTSRDGLSFLGVGVFPRTLVVGSPRPIAQVKAKLPNGTPALLGKWAVVRGIVTAGGEFGGPSYLQDATAGMAVFDSSVSNNVVRGDDVVLLGIVAPFNELFEFAPCSLVAKLSEGNAFDTLRLTTAQLTGQPQTGVEPYEGRLVRVDGITSVTTTGGAPITIWQVSGSGTNFRITDAAGTMELRVSSRTNLANLPAPSGPFDAVGVLGQFGSSYQLLPRDINDIIAEGQGPRILSQPPYESAPTPTSVTLSWTTDAPGTSTVHYGRTTAYGSTVTDTTRRTTHAVTLTGLLPATVYYVRIESAGDGGVSGVGPLAVSSASSGSSGTINVWFNKSVDPSVAVAETARVANPSQKVVERINAAQRSIDVCLYSLSGTVGATIAQALLQAKGRGVSVRVIGEKDNQGTAPWTTLRAGGITVIDDGFDATNAGIGLMHNKFFVFDNRDTLSDTDDWVIIGSWNATDPGTNDDAQNIVEIQDKALANAYTMEFEEMWGSGTDTPDAARSRFGARKLDNTPHIFSIGGVPVESYFSPSDRVTSRIIRTIDRAAASINFALLTFTRDDIADALTAKHRSGVIVRGIMDNRTDQGSEFDTLAARGIDLLLDPFGPYFHHKYLIVDAESFRAEQWVLTGSHNWSSAAENSNSENTLIFHSRRLANLYLQEFKARYVASGGTGSIVLRVERVSADVPSGFGLSNAWPNPFNPSTSVSFTLPRSARVRLTVTDLLGRVVATLADEHWPAGTYRATWNASSSASGMYLIVVDADGQRAVTRALLVR